MAYIHERVTHHMPVGFINTTSYIVVNISPNIYYAPLRFMIGKNSCVMDIMLLSALEY